MNHPRLSSQTYDFTRYDRSQSAGVVHLGVGAFHRAHQALYFDQLMTNGAEGWMICGASLRSATVPQQLDPQDSLYTAVVRSDHSEKRLIVGSISDVIFAPDNPQSLVAAIAAPQTALVTLTITEKGYLIDPASGALIRKDPHLAADLSSLDRPRTALGFIVAGLSRRYEEGLGPVTILSCDNLPDNGKRTRSAVLAFASEVDADLADWIKREVSFPSSMVDRIVPATTSDDIAALTESAGYRDEAMVKTEDFTQWVIEDNFCAARPALETTGVQMTDNVAGWEMAKLRLLNGAHSMLAYLGALAGHDFVHQAMAAPGFPELLSALWDEAEETLPEVDGLDTAIYRTDLDARFRNAALQHRTVQIAMDGSQKLPQRLLGSISDRQESAQTSPALTLSVAAWIRWQFGVDEAGKRYTVDDPLANRTAQAIAAGNDDPQAIVRAMLNIEQIFGTGLPQSDEFPNSVTQHLTSLMEKGAASVVRDFAR
ncbi:mannitol dehydrogenase family protein [Parasphingorhabdus litoris]|uniref:Mannitol dehydrogenase family protein n=1 Tax=Parasphingorhabdus litoris TaxID=394733 RepID=A0ABN1ATS8_9SPHN|nr:mannitol dehydrogenase family protein [Parasphingorhabdus litoris]